jgi:hypothetical protein
MYKLQAKALRTYRRPPRNFAVTVAVIIFFLVPIGSATGQVKVDGMKPFVNRTEGRTVHNDGHSSFTILGVHRTFAPFSNNQTIHVRFFVPSLSSSPQQGTSVLVEACELIDSFHYYMRSNDDIKWSYGALNIFEPWPTHDVIDKLGIDSGNLGVIATITTPGKPPLFLPVDVFTDHPVASDHSYTIHFITGRALQSVDVAVMDKSEKAAKPSSVAASCNTAADPGCKIYAAGSTQELRVDFSSLPAGEYHVRIVGHLPGSFETPTPADVAIYHHP